MTAPGIAVERATWRPARTLRVGDWQLGFTAGLTRRANSAMPARVGARLTDAELATVEAHYTDAGQRSVFRICAAAPADLDPRLADRGYTTASVTEVWARDLDRSLPAPPEVRIADRSRPDADWLSGWLGEKGPDADPAVAAALLTGSPARYLTATADDGTVLGVLRVATAGDWAGLSCLAVAPGARRQGIGRALTLAGLAADTGARRAFLQVETGNAGAMALYDGLGFTAVDRYVYRERSAR